MRLPTVTLADQAPVPAQQGDIWINQSTGEIQQHNGRQFGPVVTLNPQIDGPITQTIGGQTVTLTHAATAARTLTLPDATDTLVGRATTDTLSNKTLNPTSIINTAAGFQQTVDLVAGGNTSSDLSALLFQSLGRTTSGIIFADGALATMRIKTPTTLTFHAGDVGTTSAGLVMGLTTAGGYVPGQFIVGASSADANTGSTDLQLAGNLNLTSTTARIRLANTATIGFLNNAGNTNLLQIGNTGVITFPAVSTTASAANAFLDNTASNSLLRSTSSKRYKRDIRSLTLEESLAIVKGARPVKFRSKAAADDPKREHIGLVAEDEARNDERLVTPDATGQPGSVQYDRYVAPLLVVVRDLLEHMEKRAA